MASIGTTPDNKLCNFLILMTKDSSRLFDHKQTFNEAKGVADGATLEGFTCNVLDLDKHVSIYSTTVK